MRKGELMKAKKPFILEKQPRKQSRFSRMMATSGARLKRVFDEADFGSPVKRPHRKKETKSR